MLIYLASPYSHPNPDVREARFKAVVEVAAEMMKADHRVFCPIAHTHDIGKILGREVDHDFWMKQDDAILINCDKLIVLMLDGWEESRGIEHEIAFAHAVEIPVEYAAPEDFGVVEEVEVTRDSARDALLNLCRDPRVGGDPNYSANAITSADIIDTLHGMGLARARACNLPVDAKERKQHPVASGVLDYFPDAIVEISHVSWKGNEQHNPGKPLHWDRSKSTDEADTMLRHFLQRGSRDTDGMRHTAKMAWRALALLQKEIEAG